MSSNTRLGKSKGAIIILLLVLFLSINIIALFIYLAGDSKEIQTKQALRVLDDENPLEYISAAKSGNTPILETSYLTYNSGGSSSSSSNNNNDNGIGSLDDECKDFGFDFGVSKWECKCSKSSSQISINCVCHDTWTLEEELYPGTSVTGSCDNAFWDIGSSNADGIVVKAGNINHEGYYYSENGITGTIDLPKDISHITFCGYYGQPDCGNNIINQDEECDLGNNNSKECVPLYGETCTYCSSDCKNKTKIGGFCGDRIINGAEQCDDGNNIDRDGCDSNCKIEKECCDDEDCMNDSYSNDYCKDNNVYRNLTDYFCENGKCLFNIIPELFINCGNETYSEEYCYDNDVYQNHSIPGCENNRCTLSNEINKTQDCGENSSEEIKYCYSDDVWMNKSEELRGCEQGECFYSSELTNELFEDCGIDSCDDWNDYVCEGKNKTRTRACYTKGCEQSVCFNNSRIEKQSETCKYDCINGECIEQENLTIIAYKIVCDYESDLPNWGLGGPDITENTASDFIASHPDCYSENNWYFQWAYAPTSNPGDNTGEAGGNWNTFGPTDINGKAVEIINNLQQTNNLWVREVFKQEYINFTYNQNINNKNNISAELYCHIDVLNYDNYDRIDNPESGETYYCIAFNVLKEEEPFCGDGIINGDEECEPSNTPACDANCMIIGCNNNSDCGTDEWLNQDYCVCTTNVWDSWKIYECKNPGTYQSYCTNRIKIRLKQECGEDSCRDWQNYCENNDVYKNKTCYNRGCKSNSCFVDINVNTTFVQDCGENSCDSWSDYVCEGKNKTRTRTCYDTGCEQATCFNNSRIEKESEECAYDCVNNTCIHPVCGNNILEQGEECDDGNLFNGDGCSENCTLEICEHDVGIRYSYENSFGTGIAIKLNGTDNWLNDSVELTQNQDYVIKYIIDNKIENTTNNIHVVVTINSGSIIGYKKVPGCEEGRGRGGGRGGCAPSDIPIYGNTTTLADYNTSINQYHTGEVNLYISNLSAGTYNLSVYVEKINEIDCNMSDNYAEREITVKAECC